MATGVYLTLRSTELEQALALIVKAARSPALTAEAGSGLVEIVSRYIPCLATIYRFIHRLAGAASALQIACVEQPHGAICAAIASRETRLNR
ncbi:MAG: hypothetical protein WC091_18615 [Sulfuricellaceae bacterium]